MVQGAVVLNDARGCCHRTSVSCLGRFQGIELNLLGGRHLPGDVVDFVQS